MSDLYLIIFLVFAIFTSIVSLVARTHLWHIILAMFAGLTWWLLAGTMSEEPLLAVVMALFGGIFMFFGVLDYWRLKT